MTRWRHSLSSHLELKLVLKLEGPVSPDPIRTQEETAVDFDLSFRFGFLALSAEADAPAYLRTNWNSFKIDDVVVFVHPDTDVIEHTSDGGSALVIGDIYAAHGKRNIDDLLSAIVSENDLDALDQLSGRFALLISTRRDLKVFHDPFGSRTIYYASNSEFCLSSHSSLCAEASKQEISARMKEFTKLPDYKARGTVYLPGDFTMYEGVRCLTPNCLYLRGVGPQRYWPRGDITPTTLDQFMPICDEYFANTASFLTSKYNMLLGLTGGVDTRAVIAGLRATGSTVDLVTWTGGRLPENERAAVKEMVNHLGGKHTYMEPARKEWDGREAEISRAIDAGTGHCRGGSALTVNMYGISNPNDVFVRGYGGEIIRGFYNRHRAGSPNGYQPIRADGCVEDFVGSYKTRKVTDPQALFMTVVLEAMSGFAERTGYTGNMCGYDVLDLFYWEQRMGVWGANMLNEMDPAVYSFVGINSRPLYQAAFGLPAGYRLGTKLMLDITARYDPYFAEIGVVS